MLRRLMLVMSLPLFATACSSTPKLSNLKVSSTSVSAGQIVTLTATVEDDAGDLSGGKQEVTLTPSGLPSIRRDFPIAIGSSAIQAALSVSIDTAGLPAGPLKIDLQVVDKSGMTSNTLSTTVTITGP